MSLTETVKQWLLVEVLQNQKEIKRNMSQLSDDIQAVADKLTSVETSLTSFATDLQKTLADLAAKIAAGGVQQADLDAITALVPRVQAISDSLAASDTAVKTADQ